MNRNNQDELITDIYRAKLVYEAEMKSPEYQAKGEEDFEFIGKALYAKGYRRASDVVEDIIRMLRAGGINEWRYPIVADIKKKYIGKDTNVTTNTEDCDG